MSKIFIKYFFSIFILPNLFFGQSVKIELLSAKVNTLGSEFNFIKTDNTEAYYSSSTFEKDNYQSAIYKTKFINNEWQKGRYFNLGNFYSTANIFCDTDRCYFSGCDKQDNCKIFYTTKEQPQINYDVGRIINTENSNNTQPHIVQHGNQKVIYFVSDRKGGFGGLDIWVSIMGRNGAFGPPINLGNKINSVADEITPFYNLWTKELFFSSNKNTQNFDVYKSSGVINKWENSSEVKYFNTDKDDSYVYFSNEFEGHFSSNREDSTCCMDIYSFKYLQIKKDTLNQIVFSKFLPLNLYFHNDEPDPRTTKEQTNKTYKETYVSYFQMEKTYKKINKESEIQAFFQDSIKGNFNRLNSVLDKILIELNNGKKIELQLKGYASPLYDSNYNINLSQRRISSLVNYINEYKSNIMAKYLKNKDLTFIITPYGESKSSKKTSADPKNKKQSIYSISAMLERKIQIINVIFK